MHPFLVTGKTMLAKLGISQTYFVDAGNPFTQFNDLERRFIRGRHNDGAVAFTSPICDAILHPGCLRYAWRGRGLCVVFRKSPTQMTRLETLGALLHEAGHHVAACDRPERDDPNEKRAVKTFWSTGLKSPSEWHNDRWVRATVHLWRRALDLGHSIPIGDVMDMRHYRLSPAKQYADALFSECAERDGEPIESIIASTAPTAFRRLYARDTRQTQEKPNATPSPSSKLAAPKRAANTKRPPSATGRRPIHTMLVGRSVVQTFDDGTSEVDGQRVTENELRQSLPIDRRLPFRPIHIF